MRDFSISLFLNFCFVLGCYLSFINEHFIEWQKINKNIIDF